MVLLVPDDIPEESLASTIEGNVEEMCALFKDWDPRLASFQTSENCQLTVTASPNFSSCVNLSKNGVSVSDLEILTGLTRPARSSCWATQSMQHCHTWHPGTDYHLRCFNPMF